jgi:hypothetical protein
MNDRIRWVMVFVYAVAMAWVEAAVVFYLRTMYHRIDPYQINPVPMGDTVAWVEVTREAATMLMLLTVGYLAGHAWRSRLGYFAIAFGVWDIFYYVFLKIACGWPHTVMDWDVLFLIPLPWWGPVLAPVLISLLLILWGSLASQFEHIAVSIRIRAAAVPKGAQAVRGVLPTRFHWPLFCLALVLMSLPAWQRIWHISLHRRGKLETTVAD